MRKGCTLLVYLDAAAALAGGLKLFMSANGVVLCPGDEEGNASSTGWTKAREMDQGPSESRHGYCLLLRSASRRGWRRLALLAVVGDWCRLAAGSG